MDKARFIEVAPSYYALAVISQLHGRADEPITRASVIDEFRRRNEWDGFDYPIEDGKLFDIALEWLVNQGLIEMSLDDFGPPLITRHDEFVERWSIIGRDRTTVFGRYLQAGSGRIDWLSKALLNMMSEYKNLGITDDDFERPEMEWKPLPVDRDELEEIVAIKSLDASIEEVRTDNGYATSYPEERNLVLERLAALSKRFKEDTAISVAYVKENGLEIIGKLLRRFGGTAKEVAFAAAKEALKDWLRKRGFTFLNSL